jgi:hypothetical protein
VRQVGYLQELILRFCVCLLPFRSVFFLNDTPKNMHLLPKNLDIIKSTGTSKSSWSHFTWLNSLRFILLVPQSHPDKKSGLLLYTYNFVHVCYCCVVSQLTSPAVEWNQTIHCIQGQVSFPNFKQIYFVLGPCKLMNQLFEFIRQRNSIWIRHPKQHLVCPEATAMRRLIKPTPPSNTVHRTRKNATTS